MLDTQSHNIQRVNDFPETVANGGVFWGDQTSLTDPPAPIRLLAVRTRHEGQANSRDASRSQKYIEIRPKRCPEVYKVGKLYVGLLRELQPPSIIQDKWDREVRPSLEEHLRQATSMLPKSMRDEEIIIEPVLCMAGKKCSPASVVVTSGATCPKDPIALKPTVWIHCGSGKCKKKVLGTIRNLAYLNHFLDRYSMEPAYVSLHAPWPAAGERPLDTLHIEETVHKISFAIQCPVSGWTTTCGAKVRFTIQTPDGMVERYSTLGGMVVVENYLYGLTSAHAIANYFLETSDRTATEEIESTDNCNSDSSSDCETSSESESETSSRGPCSSQIRTIPTGHSSVEAHHVHKREEGIWVELRPPKILAYMGRGTTSGDYSFPDPAPVTSDFALVALGALRTLPNGFQDPVREAFTDISGSTPTSGLLSGEVSIIATCCDKPLEGYLLEGDASVILRGAVMRTKKIQVTFAGAPGLSGSWVVRRGKLCGIIYAAYDRSPYLHMLPAENMFRDIAKLLDTSNVRVATPSDIRQRKSLTILTPLSPPRQPPMTGDSFLASRTHSIRPMMGFGRPSNLPNNKSTAHVPCKFYRQGTCQAGKACPFLHSDESPAERAPCKYFTKGNCKFGLKCSFAHILPNGHIVNRNNPVGGTGPFGRMNVLHYPDPVPKSRLWTLQEHIAPMQQNYPHAMQYDIPPMLPVQTNPHMEPMKQNYPYGMQDDYLGQKLQYDMIHPVDTTFSSHPGPSYGSPSNENGKLQISPTQRVNDMDGPFPASFYSQGISHTSQYGLIAPSVPAGSPSAATSSTSRFRSFQSKLPTQDTGFEFESGSLLGTPQFGNIGSPLRSSTLHLGASHPLRAVFRPISGEMGSFASSTTREASTSTISKQLQRTRLSSGASEKVD